MSVNNNPYGTYENYNNPFMPKDPFVNREARHLTKLSLLAGAGVLSFIGVQYLFSFVSLWLSSFVTPSFSLDAVLSVLVSIFGIYVPFTVIQRFYSPEDREMCMNLNPPPSRRVFYMSALAGTAAVFIGNYITGGFSAFVSSYDIEFSMYETAEPSSPGEYLLFILQASIIPALVEEVAVRGVVMPPLRRYGDRFAIVMSAVIFAIMHGNMQQIPFAFIAGLVLGYFAIATDSLWISITIHAANNLLSVLSLAVVDDPFRSAVLTGLIVLLLVAGVYSAVKLIKEPHNGLGFTFAPKSEKTFLLASGIVFLFISYVYSAYLPEASAPYLMTALLLWFCARRYIKANNRELNKQPVCSLNLKTRVALYCATPTVVGGLVMLYLTAMQTVTVTSFDGYVFLYGGIALTIGAVVYMVYKILHSKELESKSLYRKSLYVIVAVMIVSMLSSWVSNLLMF